MKDVEKEFIIDGKTYKMVFNLNVIQNIQIKYGSTQKWGELTSKNENGEVDVSALLFGFTEMINEAIDIDNEENHVQNPYLTEKQVGRLITKLGLENVTKKVQETVIDSTLQQKNA